MTDRRMPAVYASALGALRCGELAMTLTLPIAKKVLSRNPKTIHSLILRALFFFTFLRDSQGSGYALIF
jgi:anaerobic C4-dicarboxylate transporter